MNISITNATLRIHGFCWKFMVNTLKNCYGRVQFEGEIKTYWNMSSKMRLLQICKSCNKEFIAKTTVTQCCSDACAKRYYKLKKRNEKIEQAMLQTEVRKKPDVYITPEELTLINNKITLTLKEAAVLMNISELTMRRWVFAGKVVSRKAGKKHLILKADLPL